jgi:hypothetical protein
MYIIIVVLIFLFPILLSCFLFICLCRFAEVTLKLRNCGPDAHKLDVYGHSITIVRRITREGVSSFKIKSESGISIYFYIFSLSIYYIHVYIYKMEPNGRYIK